MSSASRTIVVVAALLVTASAAQARVWGVGPNLNLGFLSEDGGGSVTNLEVPASLGGLRLTFPMQSPRAAIFLDTGLAFSSTSGAHSDNFSLTGNGQWSLTPSSAVTPYVTAGLGVLSEGIKAGPSSVSATSLTVGAGVGISRKWGDSASVRGELRYDHITKGDDGDVRVIDGGNEITFRLGFDLWVK